MVIIHKSRKGNTWFIWLLIALAIAGLILFNTTKANAQIKKVTGGDCESAGDAGRCVPSFGTPTDSCKKANTGDTNYQPRLTLTCKDADKPICCLDENALKTATSTTR